MQALDHIGIGRLDRVERARLVLAVLEFAFLVGRERHPQFLRNRTAEIGRRIQRVKSEGIHDGTIQTPQCGRWRIDRGPTNYVECSPKCLPDTLIWLKVPIVPGH